MKYLKNKTVVFHRCNKQYEGERCWAVSNPNRVLIVSAKLFVPIRKPESETRTRSPQAALGVCLRAGLNLDPPWLY